jgi:hypothetical protein
LHFELISAAVQRASMTRIAFSSGGGARLRGK